MKIHLLKCWPEFIIQIKNLRKPFEIRNLDRNYVVSDWIHDQEYFPNAEIGGRSPGRFGDLHVFAPITCIVPLGNVPGLPKLFPSVVDFRVSGGRLKTSEELLNNFGVIGLDMHKIQFVHGDEAAQAIERRIYSGELTSSIKGGGE